VRALTKVSFRRDFAELCISIHHSSRGKRYVELVSSSRCAALNSRWTVLVFLEQMKSEGASSAKSGLGLEDEFGTNINGDGQEDIASDVQEGAQSTVGSLVQRNGVVRPPYTPYASAY